MVVNLYREMLRDGEMEPLVMVNDWSALRPIERVTDGRRTFYVRLWAPWSERGSIATVLKWMLGVPFYFASLLWFCRCHRVVAFNFHYPTLNTFPIALVRFLGLYRGALILSFHGADLLAAKTCGYVERLLWRFVLHGTTAIVACSEAFGANVREFVGNAASRVQTVHNGLDIEYFLNKADRKTTLPEVLRGRDFIISVATYEERKGLDVLLRAFAEIRSTTPYLAVVLVGRPGRAEASLRALVKELGIAEDVFFFESVPHSQIYLFLEAAKVFCLPSRDETFGIAILEAGVYRLPVVASRVGGIPEIIVDGETGLLVPPDDVKALAIALSRVLSNPELARDIGERLHLRVSTEFSWAKAYVQYRALLRNRNDSVIRRSRCGSV